MKNSLIFGVSLAGIGSLALSMICSQAHAATMQFEDRLAFEEATASLTTETFNSFDENVEIPVDGVDIGDFSISQAPDFDEFEMILINGDDLVNVNGTPFVSGIGAAGESLTFTFDNPITAFGVDLFGVNNGDENVRVVIDSQTFSLPVLPNRQNSFFGVTSDNPFTAVTFNAINGEAAGLDNISFGQAGSNTTAVPESTSTIGLFLLGGLGLYIKRRIF